MKFSQAYLAVASLAATFTSATPLLQRDTLQSRADSFFLRTMPLGASITWGTASPEGNGYRKYLRQKLRFDQWNVNMVGSQQSGSMTDKDNEGWPGLRVEEVQAKAQVTVPSIKPNLVLINVGTNDANQDFQVDTIKGRMRSLIEYILGQLPETVVVYTTIVPSRDHQPNADKVNAQYRTLATELANEGKHVVLADPAKFLTIADIGSDGVHPTDDGYKKLAAVFNKGINTAYSKGWLKAPQFSSNTGSWGDDGAITDPGLPAVPASA